MDRKIEKAEKCADAIDNEYWDELNYLNQRKDQIWTCMSPEIYCIFWYL